MKLAGTIIPARGRGDGRQEPGGKWMSNCNSEGNRARASIALRKLLNSIENATKAIQTIDKHESWSRLGVTREELLRQEGIESLFEELRKAV